MSRERQSFFFWSLGTWFVVVVEVGGDDRKTETEKAIGIRDSLMYQNKMYRVYLYTIIESLEGLFVID